MFKVTVSIPTALLRFKNLKAVSNCSVAKLSTYGVIKRLQIFCKNCRDWLNIFRKGKTYIRKE